MNFTVPWPSSSCCGETWSLKILHHAFSFSLKTFYIIIIFLCFISGTKKPVLTFAQLLFQSSLKSWNIVSVLFVLFCTRDRERQNLFFWTLNWLNDFETPKKVCKSKNCWNIDISLMWLCQSCNLTFVLLSERGGEFLMLCTWGHWGTHTHRPDQPNHSNRPSQLWEQV